MSEHVYKIVEIAGSSTDDVSSAVRNAVDRASETVRNLDWFEVTEIRGHVDDAHVAHFQVTLKVGFRLE